VAVPVMDMDLTGKVAIVTGGGAGIGRAYVLALAGEGATVVAAARRRGDDKAPARNTLAEVVQAAAGLAGSVHARQCDVSDEQQVVRLIADTARDFGRIDVVVNNAARMIPHDTFAITADEWNDVLDVNLRAAYLMTREVAPIMIEQRSGSIINITAGGAQPSPKGQKTRGTLPYVVSKAGLNRLTQFMAEELREYGIAVNALSPGVVDTDQALASRKPGLSSGKPPTPEVLGPPVLFLARQTADSMSGDIVHTDEFRKSWP
jgi:3-oxoacyl-[acyl-carrier protein] reductase